MNFAGGFFVGLHHPSDAWHFERACISINRIRDRKSNFPAQSWMLDSGAFTEITTHGRYRDEPEKYADHIKRWAQCNTLKVAVSQDYMCEKFVLDITGLAIPDHQRLTIERYDRLIACDLPVPLMPVLQGYAIEDYLRHVDQYGDRLKPGMWVGVGSVCKRNANVRAIEDLVSTIHDERPDLKLHGFGLKITALESGLVRECLYSADSMAWSYAARRDGRGEDANKWQEAMKFVERIENQKLKKRQPTLFK